jgi:hypothetical protein
MDGEKMRKVLLAMIGRCCRREPLSALRGVQYFGGRGIGTGLLCLTIWAAAGLVLLGVAGLRASRHRPAVIGAAAMATI